jgi:hypothetical protein
LNKLVDARLSTEINFIEIAARTLSELSAQGKSDQLHDTLSCMAKSIDTAMVRLAQIESGL